MKYGLIGEKLSHSFSKEIHEALADYEYEIREIAKDDLDAFMQAKEFTAINVTIPYKEAVMKHLDFIDDKAKAIGAVNTVVNREGRLCGYNTDLSGLSALIGRTGVDLKGKKVLILGTGGTSKTAFAVARAMGAGEICKLSRSGRDGALTYEEGYEKHSDADFIINTTPSGMYPNLGSCPIDLNGFPKLEGVADAVYNPLRTRFILSAEAKGIPAEGGLYMLVAQAVEGSGIFLGKAYAADTAEKIYKKILAEKQSIVLIGMPGCGKSTIGKLIAERMGREFIDLDDEIVKDMGKPISEIFAEGGESYFRDIETRVLREKVAHKSSAIIATGGGAVLRDENVELLRMNGRLYFLDRPLEQLLPTVDRPLASSREAIEKRYRERYERYCLSADVHLKTDGVPKHTADDIIGDFQ